MTEFAYPVLTENAITVLERRYLAKDDQGNVIETPDEMFQRVANHLATAEDEGQRSTRAAQFFDLMRSLKWLPNSPTLMNAGLNGRPQQLSACFVLPVEDSMSDIFDALKWQAIIHKTGGGTGFSFSLLRARNSMVGSTKGRASGPVSFMKVFDAATGIVKQGGVRRGANMAILHISHPDIEDFIDMKSDLGVMTNFNVSVTIDDTFMAALAVDGDYDLIDPHDEHIVRTVKAHDLWQRIIHRAWATGEPGVVFIDRINDTNSNPTPQFGKVISTNPCGEQPLLPFESCNLGSINLALHISKDLAVDWDALAATVHTAVRALDNIVEVNEYPLPQIATLTRACRRIGLGVMGWADMLYTLGLSYNSPAAQRLAVELMRFINEQAVNASENLAAERGVFTAWGDSIYGDSPLARSWPNAAPFMPRRNSTVTTIAPTGTISIIAGCSGGIEPLFSLAFMRTVMDKDKLMEVNEIFAQVAKSEGFYSDELLADIAAQGSLQHRSDLPQWVREVFVTARDVSTADHIKMQAMFQRYTENAVSKTINLSETATEQDVDNAYRLAYELDCKGVTVYRDNSRSEQPMSTVTVQPANTPISAPVILPDGDLTGWMGRITSPQGTVRLWVTEFNGHPYECYVILGKSGSDLMAMGEAIGRMISVALRGGLSLQVVIDQLQGIGGSRSVGFGARRVLSVPDAIAKILARHYEIVEAEITAPIVAAAYGDLCPECGNTTLVHAEGCKKCVCGYSEC